MSNHPAPSPEEPAGGPGAAPPDRTAPGATPGTAPGAPGARSGTPSGTSRGVAPAHPHELDGPDDGLDPAESLRLIQEQRQRVQGLDPDGRLLYGAWGVAWLAGYLVLWFSARGDLGPTGGPPGQPAAWAFVTYGGLLMAALALTIVHIMVRSSGIRGTSATTGAMYGWAWFLGFTTMGFILGGIARAGASGEVMGLASNALGCLVVGLMYLSGGALWKEWRLYILGAWILVVAAVATFAGIPTTYLVMAVLGGGGFLVMAGVDQVLRLRARRASPAAHHG